MDRCFLDAQAVACAKARGWPAAPSITSGTGDPEGNVLGFWPGDIFVDTSTGEVWIFQGDPNTSTGWIQIGTFGVNSTLLAWVESGAYQPTLNVYDENGILVSSQVVWPDGTPGVLTVTDVNTDFFSVDGYTMTYKTKTITQPLLTRDENGNATIVPELIIT